MNDDGKTEWWNGVTQKLLWGENNAIHVGGQFTHQRSIFLKTVYVIHAIKWYMYIYINVFKQGNSGAYETKEEVNDELCSENPESDHSEDNGEHKKWI